MTVTLESRHDLTLAAFRRVAWQRETVALEPAIGARMTAARAAFRALLDDERTTIYGVTSGFGDRATLRLSPAERAEQAREAADRGVSFGEPLPERVTRGIVFARLANLVDGHGAVRFEVAEAVAGMLAAGELPLVPSQGNGGSGEILALGHLFELMGQRLGLQEKEGNALVNGSPCGAALLADGALAAEGRIALAYQAFALSVEAFAAPLEAYDPALAALWGDAGETAALGRLGALLAGARDARAGHQAPVSYRILPRVLGQAERALADAQRGASSSLSSVTDNPVFIPPGPGRPRGRVFSTGGYHNALAPQQLHALTVVYADLCRLAERHVEALWMGPGKRQSVAVEELLSLALMVTTGWVEEAVAAAQPPLMPRSGPGQNDAGAPAFLAWRRNAAAAAALDACLALLFATATQIILADGIALAPPLRDRCARVVAICPATSRPYDASIAELARSLGAEILPCDRGRAR
jgi:histidine ammonia-lyase